jgi:hypothetical protein
MTKDIQKNADGTEYVLDDAENNDPAKGAGLGAVGGVVVGGAAGSMVGPAGAIAGAVVGGVAGAIASGLGVAAADTVDKDGEVVAVVDARNDNAPLSPSDVTSVETIDPIGVHHVDAVEVDDDANDEINRPVV